MTVASAPEDEKPDFAGNRHASGDGCKEQKAGIFRITDDFRPGTC